MYEFLWATLYKCLYIIYEFLWVVQMFENQNFNKIYDTNHIDILANNRTEIEHWIYLGHQTLVLSMFILNSCAPTEYKIFRMGSLFN